MKTDRKTSAPIPSCGKLRRQCLAAALVGLLALGATAGLGHMYHNRLAGQLDLVFDDGVPRAAAALRFALDVLRCRSEDQQFEVATGEPRACARAVERWTAAAEGLQQSLAEVGETAADALGEDLERWRADTAAYCRAVAGLAAQIGAGRPPVPEEFRGRLQVHRAHLDALAAEAQVLAQTAFRQTLDRRHAVDRLLGSASRLASVAFITCALLLAATVLWIVRAVLDRVNVVADAFRRLAEGNLKTRLSCDSGDEIARLARHFNEVAADLERRSRQPEVAPTGDSEKNAPQPAVRASRRVLVAEDGPENRRFMALVLQRAGAEVTLAENGREAVDKAVSLRQEGASFDLVLMDMQMPVMDGREAVRRLRDEGCTSLIVAVTGHGERHEQRACLDAGCDRYVQKPLDRETLLKLLADATPCARAADGR